MQELQNIQLAILGVLRMGFMFGFVVVAGVWVVNTILKGGK